MEVVCKKGGRRWFSGRWVLARAKDEPVGTIPPESPWTQRTRSIPDPLPVQARPQRRASSPPPSKPSLGLPTILFIKNPFHFDRTMYGPPVVPLHADLQASNFS